MCPQKIINPIQNINNKKEGDLMDETCMSESEVNDFVENFKGMLWDDVDDALADMTREDMIAVIKALKKRFG